MRVDFNTTVGTRGRFARLCIQLDIDKPLVRMVRVGKTKLAVLYEGVGLLCFHCGKIGHRQEWCPNRAAEEFEQASINAQSRPGMEEEDKQKGFGPWMVVTRRKRQTKPTRGRELDSNTPSRNIRNGGHGNGATGSDVPSAQGRDYHATHFKYSKLEKGKKTQSNGLQDNANIGPAGLNNLNFSVGPSNISNSIIEEISIQSKPLDLPASFSAKPNFSSSLQQPSAAPNTTISLRP